MLEKKRIAEQNNNLKLVDFKPRFDFFSAFRSMLISITDACWSENLIEIISRNYCGSLTGTYRHWAAVKAKSTQWYLSDQDGDVHRFQLSVSCAVTQGERNNADLIPDCTKELVDVKTGIALTYQSSILCILITEKSLGCVTSWPKSLYYG